MFKVSFDWLKKFCNKNITYREILNILDLQGFEVKGEQDFGNDKVITIEVKANRPDMLSHIGVAREICAYLGEKIPEINKNNLKIDNDKFPIKINIEESKVCKRFCGLIINNINNEVETPEYIKDYLEKLGINCINAVVDIANYVMLDLGQPMHTYDIDKISSNEIKIRKSDSECKVNTLGNKPVDVQKGDIVISDSEDVLCIAGIIGSEKSMVQKNTKNIMIEAACFDEVSIRLTSRRLKVSTPSSFRFERGIDESLSADIMLRCAKLINKICGGEFCKVAFDYYPYPKKKNIIDLRVSRTNDLLGINISKEDIYSYLTKYDFRCENINNDIIRVECPSYRLDLLKEVDLIEEVARIHGYDNIEPIMPKITSQYNKNQVWENMDVIRKILRGVGFNEVINYSFIPIDIMNTLKIEKENPLYSELTLKNPIARDYALMRPTLIYSLLNCLAYNYSRNNTDLALFEIGRCYFEDKTKDTGCKEEDMLGMIVSGARIKKGWGIDKDIKYNYYDIINFVDLLFNEFGQKYELKESKYGFCEPGTGFDIFVSGKRVGFIAEMKKDVVNKIPNVKLIKDKIFYCELALKELDEKIKKLQFESKYPMVNRLYNIVQKKNVSAQRVIDIIKSSSDLIKSVLVRDVYEDKKMNQDEYAVLYEIDYCSKTQTLTSEQIESIENIFLNKLNNELKAVIKR